MNDIELNPLEEVTYVIMVNKDWKMSTGKVGAQITNVAVQLPKVKLTKECPQPRTYVYDAPEWYMEWMIRDFEEKLDIKWTIDSGHTEYTIGCLTALGFKRELWMKPFTNCLDLHRELSLRKRIMNKIFKCKRCLLY